MIAKNSRWLPSALQGLAPQRRMMDEGFEEHPVKTLIKDSEFSEIASASS
jgi:hypothetical protein